MHTPGDGEDTDTALMRAVAAGDRPAVAELYDRHASAVYGMAVSLLHDQALAQDVSQEAFVRLWTRAHTFDAQRGTPLGWLLSVTRNLALDELRRQRRALDRAARIASDAAVLGEGQMDLLLHQQWESQRVNNAVKELSSVQRETVEMVYFQGLTLLEVAERLHVALGTVKSRLHSALVSLRAALADETSRPNLARGTSS
ncbi:MAG: RNA polymerase sigma factor [Chloroflexota bacterium]